MKYILYVGSTYFESLVLNSCSLPARFNIGVGPGWWWSQYLKERLIDLNFLHRFADCSSLSKGWLLFSTYRCPLVCSVGKWLKLAFGRKQKGKEKWKSGSFYSNRMYGQVNVSSSPTCYEWVPTHPTTKGALSLSHTGPEALRFSLGPVTSPDESSIGGTCFHVHRMKGRVSAGELSPCDCSMYPGSAEPFRGTVKGL